MEKVGEWADGVNQLGTHLPAGDFILMLLKDHVKSFQEHLPVLCQLSDQVFQVSFNAPFCQIAETYCNIPSCG